MRGLHLATIATLLLGIQISSVFAADDCRGVPGITPLCGFQAPEDLVLSPDGKALIIGEFGGLVDPVPGRITRLDLATQAHATLYPAADVTSDSGTAHWGDAACPGAPGAAFAPHGMHLSQRADGRWQLLVVNHYARESVEFFEWRDAGQLSWRGCVVLPQGAFLNDVVGFADGSFVATNMAEIGDEVDPIAELMSGTPSGKLWSWMPNRSTAVIPGEALHFPNGIERSIDGETLYVNVYGTNEVRRIARATGKVLGTTRIKKPDNSYWAEDGRLLVASHTGEIDYAKGECHSLASYCPMAFEIVALDPVTLTGEVVFAHEGSPMGGGTVAVPVGEYLYIGSFAGDRLIRVQLSE